MSQRWRTSSSTLVAVKSQVFKKRHSSCCPSCAERRPPKGHLRILDKSKNWCRAVSRNSVQTQTCHQTIHSRTLSPVSESISCYVLSLYHVCYLFILWQHMLAYLIIFLCRPSVVFHIFLILLSLFFSRASGTVGWPACPQSCKRTSVCVCLGMSRGVHVSRALSLSMSLCHRLGLCLCLCLCLRLRLCLCLSLSLSLLRSLFRSLNTHCMTCKLIESTLSSPCAVQRKGPGWARAARGGQGGPGGPGGPGGLQGEVRRLGPVSLQRLHPFHPVSQ